MSTVGVATTQNVYIEYTAANVMERMGASLLDIGVQILLIIGYVLLIGELDVYNETLNWIFFSSLLVYSLVFETFFSGQTIGKMVLKIQVVRLDGSPASIGEFFIRWLTGLIELYATFGTIAFVTVLLSKRGQRLGDIAAGTTVVRRPKRVSLDDLMLSTRVTSAPEVPQAVMLTDSDVATIREVLAAKKGNFSDDKVMELIWKTAEKLTQMLGTGPVTQPVEYLESLLSSYQTIHSDRT